MKLYQLVCYGRLSNFPSSTGKYHSRKVFATSGDAEGYAEEFLQLCCGHGLTDLDRDTAKFAVVELEFQPDR